MTKNPLLGVLAGVALASTAAAQNDECASAMMVSNGDVIAFDTSTATLSAEPWNCALNGGPDLWYSITSTTGGPIIFETCGSSYDTALEAFDGSCAALNLLVCNDDACGLQSSVSFQPTVGQTYYVRVGGYNNATGPGTLTVTEAGPPNVMIVDNIAGQFMDISATGAPLSLADDGEVDVVTTIGNHVLAAGLMRVGSNGAVRFDGSGLELGYVNNPIPSSSAFLGDQTLMPFWDDIDTDNGTEGEIYVQEMGGVLIVQWEEVEFFPGGTGTDTATFQLQVPGGSGPIVAQYVYESVDSVRADFGSSATIGFQSNGVGGFTDATWSYNEPLSVMNGTVLTITTGPGQVGTNYCTASVNSTGVAASISASGSSNIAMNDLTLIASDMPTSAFGFFLTSPVQGFVPNPGGSMGNLCLGGAIGRYVGPGQIQNSGSAGEISLLIDNQTMPTPTGPVSVMTGDVYNFTAWFRDAVGGQATSNFTDGLEVTFF